MRLPAAQERLQPRLVIGDHRAAHGGSLREHAPPFPQFPKVPEDAQIDEAVEDVEVAEHRREHRVDQREAVASEIGSCTQLILETACLLPGPALPPLPDRGTILTGRGR